MDKVYIVKAWWDDASDPSVLCVYDNMRAAQVHIEKCVKQELEELLEFNRQEHDYDDRNGVHSRVVFNKTNKDNEVAEFWYECWNVQSD